MTDEADRRVGDPPDTDGVRVPGLEPVFRHLEDDDVPWQEVKTIRRSDGARAAVWEKWLAFSADPQYLSLYARYDPGMIVRRHGHLSPHIVFVLEGELDCGGRSCPAGTHVELPRGAAFGPLVAGPTGAVLFEVMLGDPRSWGDDRQAFRSALASHGAEELPDPPLQFPDWLRDLRSTWVAAPDGRPEQVGDPVGAEATADRGTASTPQPHRPVTLTPIGQVVGGRTQPLDDQWASVEARIELDPSRFDAASVAGLDTFSHVDVVFLFDRVTEEAVVTGSRHPRGREDWPPVGIFAQRAKDRPNRLGVSTCELVRVTDTVLHVRGLDAIDGTPVLDLKPHVPAMGPRGPMRQPPWMDELMAGYW